MANKINVQILTTLLLGSLLLSSCVHTASEKNVNGWRLDNSELYKDSLYQNNNIYFSERFRLDSSAPLGERFYYNRSGGINRWCWYNYALVDKDSDAIKYPQAIVYFDSLGKFEKFKGNPVINSAYSVHYQYVVELINPPSSLNLVAAMIDSFGAKEISKVGYEPNDIDSFSRVVFDIKFVEGHNYFFNYLILDSNSYVVYKYEKEVEVDFDKLGRSISDNKEK